jgi:hypothetical protein
MVLPNARHIKAAKLEDAYLDFTTQIMGISNIGTRDMQSRGACQTRV